MTKSTPTSSSREEEKPWCRGIIACHERAEEEGITFRDHIVKYHPDLPWEKLTSPPQQGEGANEEI